MCLAALAEAAVAAFLSEPDGIFTFKEEQRVPLKAFLQKKRYFHFTPEWLRREFN